jgi:hypothetical protein
VDVTITTADEPGTLTVTKALGIFRVEQTSDWQTLGRKRREENYKAYGWVLCLEYGSGESVIDAARMARWLSMMS